MKGVVFTFGRFNPPTKGHLSVVEGMKNISNSMGYSCKVFTSRKHDTVRNPIPYTEKINYIERILGMRVENSDNIVSIFDVIHNLSDQGYSDLIMVVGSDRKRIFEKKLLHYVGTEFNINSLKIVSVNRNENGSMDTDGISSSQMRNFAKDNNFKDFRVGLPKNIHITDSKQLFKEVQKGLLYGRENTSSVVR